MSHAWTHTWCTSPSRDEAVRAAEDGRDGPLPTLEECISRAGQFAPSEPPQEQKCTERENVTERRPVDAGGGENVTADFAEEAKRYLWNPSASLSETGETQSRMRTELVTLEVTHRFVDPIASVLLGALDLVLGGPGECVFVMDGSCEITKLTDERDAAIRERDAAKARVVELEEQLESVACRAATAENRVAELESAAKAAPAASADAGSNQSPPPAKGWLTAEERDSIQHAANLAKACWSYSVAQELENILARSTPPEVVLEDFPLDAVRNLDPKYLAGWYQCMASAERALAAAGVRVKEVGRE